MSNYSVNDPDLDKKFQEMLKKLLYSDGQIKPMMSLKPAQKVMMMENLSKQIKVEPKIQIANLRAQKNEDNVEKIRVSLSQSDEKTMKEFLELGVVQLLLETVTELNKKANKTLDDMKILNKICMCFKKLVDNDNGVSPFATYPGTLRELMFMLHPPEIHQTDLWEYYYIIAAAALDVLCLLIVAPADLIPNSFGMVMEAVDFFRSTFNEEQRFKTLLTIFTKDNTPQSLKIAIVKMFLCILIKTDLLHVRLQLRGEFDAFGFSDVCAVLAKRITTDPNYPQIYLEEKEADEKDSATLNISSGTNIDPKQTFQALLNTLQNTYVPDGDLTAILNEILRRLYDLSPSNPVWADVEKHFVSLVSVQNTPEMKVMLERMSGLNHIEEIQKSTDNAERELKEVSSLVDDVKKRIGCQGEDNAKTIKTLTQLKTTVDNAREEIRKTEAEILERKREIEELKSKETTVKLQIVPTTEADWLAAEKVHKERIAEVKQQIADLKKKYAEDYARAAASGGGYGGGGGGGGIGGPPPPLGGGGDIPPPPLGGGDIPPPPGFGGGDIPPPPGLDGEGGVPPPPPLGGEGGVPPPPPMGAPAAPTIPKKASPKPHKPMKVFHWSRIPDIKIEGTVWKQLSDNKVKVNISELEELFEKKETKKGALGGGGDDAPKGPPKEVVPVLLDPKRINNVGIMLSQFGNQMTPEDVAAAVEKCDLNVLTPERIKSLCNFIPTDDEIATLNDFTGDASKLTKSERFFLKIKDITHLEQRLRSFLFRNRSDEILEYLGPSYDTILEAAGEVEKSKSFRSVLETVLAIGNYLNGGTAAGGAYGFKLDVLSKIADFKSIDNQTTLFNYVVKKLKESGRYQTLLDELKHVTAASKLPLVSLAQDMGELNLGLNQMTNEITLMKNSLGDGDGGGGGDGEKKGAKLSLNANQKKSAKLFLDVITPFHQTFLQKHKKLGEKKADVEKKVTDLITTFNEDPKKMPCEEFFEIFSSFVTRVERTSKDMDAKEERLRKEAERKVKEEARKAALAAAKAGKATAASPKAAAGKGPAPIGSPPAEASSSADGEEGGGGKKVVMDNLNEQLNSGALLRRNRTGGK